MVKPAHIVRLVWIDARLEYKGTLNRSDIQKAFHVSRQQASAEIARYKEAFPHRLGYDIKQKLYCRKDSESVFRPEDHDAARRIVHDTKHLSASFEERIRLYADSK